MNYYTVADIKQLTGLSQTASYDLIRNLNNRLKREYPGTIVLTAKIPKWYFNKKTKMIGDEENEEQNEKDKQD